MHGQGKAVNYPQNIFCISLSFGSQCVCESIENAKYSLGTANIIYAQQLLQKALFATAKAAIQWHFKNPTEKVKNPHRIPHMGNLGGTLGDISLTSIPTLLRFIQLVCFSTSTFR